MNRKNKRLGEATRASINRRIDEYSRFALLPQSRRHRSFAELHPSDISLGPETRARMRVSLPRGRRGGKQGSGGGHRASNEAEDREAVPRSLPRGDRRGGREHTVVRSLSMHLPTLTFVEPRFAIRSYDARKWLRDLDKDDAALLQPESVLFYKISWASMH